MKRSTKWDIFLSHATEDQQDFVRPLADALEQAGIKVWYSESALKLGDNLRRSIDNGLAQSKYGVVVLSPAFFSKHWPQYELDSLAQLEVNGRNVILPVWHNVNRDDVVKYSASLANKVAAMSSDGIAKVVAEIVRIVKPQQKKSPDKRVANTSSNIPVPHQLPTVPKDFVGREEELEELMGAASREGVAIFAMRGMGGIGKTALALKLANQLAECYPDGHFYLDLKGTTQPIPPKEALAHIISGYFPNQKLPEDETELISLYRSVLHGKHALLLTDNALDEKQVEPLIPPAGNLLLVTSRNRFYIEGLYPKDLDKLPPDKACELLCRIARRLQPDEAAQLAELCDYLPLALRLAAGTLATRIDIPANYYIRQLTEKDKRLEFVEQSLSLSYDMLSSQMRRFWRTLAVFPDSFDEYAAAAVWEISCEKVGKAKDKLSELVAYSLVEWDKDTGRYQLHDLVRLFAESKLSEPEKHAAQLSHAKHYKDILNAADNLYVEGGDNVLAGLMLFDSEWLNIQAGQTWAAIHTDHDQIAAAICNQYPNVGADILDLRLHPRAWIAWLEVALMAAGQLQDRAMEGVHLGNMGLAHTNMGEPDRAIEYLEQTLMIFREVGNRRCECKSLGNLGLAYASLNEERRAIEYHELALEVSRDLGDKRAAGYILGNLGLAYYQLGEQHRAIEYLEQALIISRELGGKLIEGHTLGNLGNAYAALGEPHRAMELYEQQLELARAIGDRRDEGTALWNMSLALYNLGKWTEAIKHAEAALRIYEQIEDPNAAKVREQLQQWQGK